MKRTSTRHGEFIDPIRRCRIQGPHLAWTAPQGDIATIKNPSGCGRPTIFISPSTNPKSRVFQPASPAKLKAADRELIPIVILSLVLLFASRHWA
jgi:ABC-type uncharacterized transport system YnjBCD ATPase subunit